MFVDIAPFNAMIGLLKYFYLQGILSGVFVDVFRMFDKVAKEKLNVFYCNYCGSIAVSTADYAVCDICDLFTSTTQQPSGSTTASIAESIANHDFKTAASLSDNLIKENPSTEAIICSAALYSLYSDSLYFSRDYIKPNGFMEPNALNINEGITLQHKVKALLEQARSAYVHKEHNEIDGKGFYVWFLASLWTGKMSSAKKILEYIFGSPESDKYDVYARMLYNIMVNSKDAKKYADTVSGDGIPSSAFYYSYYLGKLGKSGDASKLLKKLKKVHSSIRYDRLSKELQYATEIL